jgi:hypothetical protein
MNDTTATVPVSARSVSFKDHDNNDSPSSKSTVLAANPISVLDKLGMLVIHLSYSSSFLVVQIPEEYEQNLRDLEHRNKLLNEEVQQVRLNNRVNQSIYFLLLLLFNQLNLESPKTTRRIT